MSLFRRPASGRLLASFVALSCVAACGDRDSSTSSASPSSTVTSRAVDPVPASSIDARGWLDRGMPPPERPWTAKDYGKAAATLRSMPASAYPRAGDTTSNLFARFVANDNLDLVRDPKVPLDTRMQEAIDILGASRDLSSVYLGALAQGAPLRKEMLAFMALHVNESTSMLDLLEAFVRTLDPKDPKFDARMQGLTRVEDGMAEVAMVAVMTLTEKSEYAIADLVEFTKAITPTLPKTVSRLTPTNRTQVLAKLEDAKRVTDPELAAAITTLAKATESEPPRPVEDLKGAASAKP